MWYHSFPRYYFAVSTDKIPIWKRGSYCKLFLSTRLKTSERRRPSDENHDKIIIHHLELRDHYDGGSCIGRCHSASTLTKRNHFLLYDTNWYVPELTFLTVAHFIQLTESMIAMSLQLINTETVDTFAIYLTRHGVWWFNLHLSESISVYMMIIDVNERNKMAWTLLRHA